MALVSRLAVPATLLVLTACGGAAPPPSRAHAQPPPAKSAEPPPPAPPVTSLQRAEVKEMIAKGLGAFLQNVAVEDWPVMHQGKFFGFKIRAINPAWRVDLAPGDVVTRVNGIVPERPEEADAALRSLAKASSLKVEFERDGKAKTLELPIVD